MAAEEKPYWNMDIEPKLGTPEIVPIQVKNLQRQAAFCYENSQILNRFMDDIKLKPEDITSLDVFREAFPILDKSPQGMLPMLKYVKNFKGMASLYEQLCCVPKSKIVLMAATSGTTGDPSPYYFTEKEMDVMREGFARAAWRSGLRPGDWIIHAMALSMFGAGVPLVDAIRAYGACAVPVGAESGTERVLKFAEIILNQNGHIDCMCVTPSFAEYLIDKAPEVVLKKPISEYKIKLLICGGEPGAGLPEVKAKLEKAFNCKVIDMMGLIMGIMWASCDHDEYQGMHYISEDLAMVELIDPDTKKTLPMEDGAIGSAVITPLATEFMPLLRFDMGDIMQLYTKPCPCGRTGYRFKVKGRVDDMLKVKGVLIYPASVDNVIAGFTPRLTGEFRILLDEPPPRVVPPLKLKIEYGEGVQESDLPELEKELVAKMHSAIKISPAITWVKPNSLERSVHKTTFIEKLWEKK